ncbi:acyl-CoA desaturase [Streptomyces sp. NPDC000410]|uniref:acyl-CoA desaturase n=1 Tax=Streptomyces sp. NPDC000410 TaxID=3154254 RepID=UPI0033231330
MAQATAIATALVAEPAPPPGASSGRSGGSDFAPLLRSAKERGLLERRFGWYARVITLNLLGLVAVLTGLVLSGPSWWAVLFAVPLALLSARTAFIAHDAGHAQITSDRRVSRVLQLFHANLLLGMSQDWWNDKHNRHHANPNHVDKDPDVAPDVLVFSKEHAEGRTGLRSWLTRHQAWLFFPLTTLEGIALKVYGFQHVFPRSGSGARARAGSGPRSGSGSALGPASASGSGERRRAEGRAVEGGLLIAHVLGYVTLLLTLLTPLQALAFALLHQMLLGLHLGMAFAPNHKGMEMPDPNGGERWGHLQRQVLTSRNIRGGPLTDWFLGGLNYQIEHHLFPSMPRPHLRLVQPLVRAHCRRLGMPYTETGLIESYRQALGHMHEVGEALRADTEGKRRDRRPEETAV